MEAEQLDETVNYVAIRRLQAAYADTVTRRAWAELGELFLPEATVTVDTITSPPIELTGARELAKFVSSAIARFEFFEFVPLNSRVSIGRGGDSATARMYICELRQHRDSGQWTNAFGVYSDLYRKVGGRWWFERRRYRSMARTGRSEVFPLPEGFGTDA